MTKKICLVSLCSYPVLAENNTEFVGRKEAQKDILVKELIHEIYANVIILKEVIVLETSIIGDSSVVTINIPKYIISASNPASIIQNRFEDT